MWLSARCADALLFDSHGVFTEYTLDEPFVFLGHELDLRVGAGAWHGGGGAALEGFTQGPGGHCDEENGKEGHQKSIDPGVHVCHYNGESEKGGTPNKSVSEILDRRGNLTHIDNAEG